VPSITEQTVGWEAERGEFQAVLRSHLFARSPALSHLLSYLCEKKFSGEADQIKEYSIALEVFDRRETFDQDSDSIVRVQANRLRKRLGEYYASEGNQHSLRIKIPVGQYVPIFEKLDRADASEAGRPASDASSKNSWRPSPWLIWILGGAVLLLTSIAGFLVRERSKAPQRVGIADTAPSAETFVGLPVGEEIRILAGASRKYVDHAGKLWTPDSFFSGGTATPTTAQHIWRTQDPIVYRTSRQGDFAYNIPLKSGTYELRLHFAENFYGPENSGGGGEGSRIMTVAVNGVVLLHDFDVLADSGGDRTAEVKVFPDVSPASDGRLHLAFASAKGGSAMLSAIEILPGARGKIRPIRIAARDVPYYSNDSQWWSPDMYFKGGQLSSSQEAAEGTDDPEFYETERWGHFSYAIPVATGRYTVTLHFIEHSGSAHNASSPGLASEDRVFNVFCNGKTILSNLDLEKQAGENHAFERKIKGLEPNAQGKLLLEFVPVVGYATVTAIEVLPE
jgi:hypothetical protein